MSTGIQDTDRKQIVEGLAEMLADTYSLYLKTQGYHWNVEGPMFRSLHLLFEEQYQELAEGIDLLAERIRALGEFAPASFAEFSELSSITQPKRVPDAVKMVEDLVEGHETVIKKARDLVSTAEEADDVGTADLVTGRIEAHEKASWMLRSTAA
ncbi:MAG TPA: Dps family protein [Acidimicrobiia bacterium]